MRIHQLGIDDALASLDSSLDGLPVSEAERRLREFGPNRVERLTRSAPWRQLAASFTHVLALILWAAAALAFVAAWLHPGAGMETLGLAILAVILVNGVFSYIQEYRAERALDALQKLLPTEVVVSRGGRAVRIEAEGLVPGDVILLAAGDNVPADSRVIEARALRVDNATITGESTPQERNVRSSVTETILESRNVLLAGTSIVSGEARALVFATGMRTEFGRIAQLTQTIDSGSSPLLRQIKVLSRLIAILSAALGILLFVVGRSVGLSFWENAVFAVGIIVANVPEGLLPTVTLSLAMGAQRMARRKALVRHLPAVETMGSVTVICTDKTGTLTWNRMTVERLFLDGRSWPQSVPPEVAARHRPFYEVAGSCHSLRRSGGAWLGDPLEIALVDLARASVPASEYPRVDEIPFDSDRRRLSTLHRTPEGLVLYTKGALESLLPLCSLMRIDADPVPLDEMARANILAAEAEMAEAGLRVLALASRTVAAGEPVESLERSLTLLGLVGLDDPPRPEVPRAVEQCRGAGIRVIMVTGDHPGTAAAIGRRIGLVGPSSTRAVTGGELAHLSDVQLQIALDRRDAVFARVTADQKLRIVDALRRKGEIVAVTGDGVNDAPALRLADIGIAMGRSGSDVARESADMVLMDDNFATIVSAVEEGRAVYANIRKFLTYILTSNVAELVPYLAFMLFRVPLPLTIIQILVVDLGTDLLPALGLGAEQPRPELMRRPPRRRSGRLLDAGLLARAYLFLGPIEAACGMGAYFLVLQQGGWEYGSPLAAGDPLYLQATTACLAAIVVAQVANAFACRDDTISTTAIPLLGNPLLLTGIAAEIALLLLLVYSTAGNLLFGTAPLDGWVWLLFLAGAAALLLLDEGRKALAASWSRRSGTGNPVPLRPVGPSD